jgi:hypothetical protein
MVVESKNRFSHLTVRMECAPGNIDPGTQPGRQRNLKRLDVEVFDVEGVVGSSD